MQSYQKLPIEQAIEDSTEILGRLYQQAQQEIQNKLFGYLRTKFASCGAEITWQEILDQSESVFTMDKRLLSALDIKHWQPDFRAEVPPVLVLNFLGEFIKTNTDGKLVSEINITSDNVNNELVSFELGVPILKYKFEIFKILGKEYPTILTNQHGWILPIANTVELVEHVRSILSHDQIQKMLDGWLNQIIEARIRDYDTARL